MGVERPNYSLVRQRAVILERAVNAAFALKGGVFRRARRASSP